MPPVPQLLRSAGISVLLSQAPFANRKKSSPGGTARSMPARSMPDSADAGAAGGVLATGGATEAVAAGFAGALTTGGSPPHAAAPRASVSVSVSERDEAFGVRTASRLRSRREGVT